jgi:hypothetical protein
MSYGPHYGVYEYDLDEVVKLVEAADGTGKGHRSGKAMMSRPDFCPMEWDETVRAMVFGTPIVGEVDEALHDRFMDRINEIVQEDFHTVHGVEGAWVDVDRYVMGEPECMIDFGWHKAMKPRKAIKLLVSCSIPAYVGPEVIEERGRKIMELVQGLLASGINVELWNGLTASGYYNGNNKSNKYGNFYATILVQAKPFEDVVDPEVLNFVFTNPAFLRRVMFYLMEELPIEERRALNVGKGYGGASDMPETIVEQFDAVIEGFGGTEFDPEKVFEKLVTVSEEDRIVDEDRIEVWS